MAIGEICNREVVVVESGASVAEAAKLMRQYHVGTLVVVRQQDSKNEPLGIITDRDLVLEVLSPELDAANITVGEIMTPELVKVTEGAGVVESIRYMRAKGVRRMPVVDGNGVLAGIITVDDLIDLLSEELAELNKLVKQEQRKEAGARR